MFTAITTDRGKVVAKAAGEFNEAQGDNACAVVDQAQYLFSLKAAIPFAGHFHLDPEFALDSHPRDDVGREFAIGGDDVVACPPINPFAIIANPAEVFGAKAISSSDALINRADSSRALRIAASHSRKWTAPFSNWSRVCACIRS
jgi:hypothetical protein